MPRLLPLAVLALAACDPPLEELFPPRYYAFERGGVAYDVRAQYDPFVRGWFVNVSSLEVPLPPASLPFAMILAEQQVGALVCDGRQLDVEPGDIWNPLAADRITYLDSLGSWRFVGRCTDVPAVAPAAAAGNPWMAVADPDAVIIIDAD